MIKLRRYSFLLFVPLLCALGATHDLSNYKVVIDGIQNKALSAKFLNASCCYALKSNPLSSLALLKERVEQDREKLTELAHYYGYYNAAVTATISPEPKPQIQFHVLLGAPFTLKSVQIVGENTEDLTLLPETLSPHKLVSTQLILDYEKALIRNLKIKGYPKAEVRKKDIIADVKTETLEITFYVETGSKRVFGPLQIHGNSNVSDEAIAKYITWNEGDLYTPIAIEQTESALEKTGLFTSVIVSHDELTDEALPVTINVQEAKHKSIGMGLSYTTTWGPGVTAEWENRNLGGEGDILGFRTEVWHHYQTATLSLTKPKDKSQNKQNIWLLEYNKLHTLPFDSHSYSVSGLTQKQMNRNAEFGLGLRLEWLHAKNYDSNQTYYLIKCPIQVKISNADNLFDPLSGQTLNIKVTPTTQIQDPHIFYGTQTTSFATYHSLPNKFFTLASKVVFGSIMGASRNTIPPPDRFYGGSENVLRGYRAFTVSPLHHRRIPLGGRSILAASIETRFRTQGSFGWVFFYDLGNVYEKNVPKFPSKQLQSLGAGIRYNTPIGPLRFDVALPLNRRPHIDPHYQIFFSIGQAF